MTGRISTIRASELTVEHLYLMVDVPVSMRAGNRCAGQLLGYTITELSTYLILGPAQHPRSIEVLLSDQVDVLDAPEPAMHSTHFTGEPTA